MSGALPRLGSHSGAILLMKDGKPSVQEKAMPATAQTQPEKPATRFAKDQLKAVIERIERLEEEKKATSDDIRDVYAEAKGNGFERIERLEEEKKATSDNIRDVYAEAK